MNIIVVEKDCAQSITLPCKSTVTSALEHFSINPETVLVKRNSEFVADFSSEKLKEKDTLEIIRIVSQG